MAFFGVSKGSIRFYQTYFHPVNKVWLLTIIFRAVPGGKDDTN